MAGYGGLFPHIVHLQYGANVLSDPSSRPCHTSCVAKKNRRIASLGYHITHRNSAPSNLLPLPGFKDTSHQPYCATFYSTQSKGLFTPYSSSRYDKNSDFPTASRQFIIDCMGGPRGSPCRKRVMSIKSLRGLTRRVGLEFDRGSCSAGYQTFFVASGNVSGTLQWRYSTGHASILSTQLGSWAYIPAATV